jgi:hypothetical protein
MPEPLRNLFGTSSESLGVRLGLVVFAKHDPRLLGWEKLSAAWGQLL